eukprot:322151-Prorocentrum_lima.AAC.1
MNRHWAAQVEPVQSQQPPPVCIQSPVVQVTQQMSQHAGPCFVNQRKDLGWGKAAETPAPLPPDEEITVSLRDLERSVVDSGVPFSQITKE